MIKIMTSMISESKVSIQDLSEHEASNSNLTNKNNDETHNSIQRIIRGRGDLLLVKSHFDLLSFVKLAFPGAQINCCNNHHGQQCRQANHNTNPVFLYLFCQMGIMV